jgi:hypothetical protein
MLSQCARGARFGAGAIIALIMCALGPSIGAQAMARPSVSRVVALPSGDRASLMIELTDPVPRAALTSAAGTTSATIEIGPLATVAAQELVSGHDSSLISRVAIRTYRKATQTFARVVVELRAACGQQVRVAGRRIYLDLAPVAPAHSRSTPTRPAPAPSSSASTGLSAPGIAPTSGSGRRGAAQAPLATPLANAGSEDAIDQSYGSLEADALRRAKALAAQPNVKALETLRQKVIRRNAQLGGRRTERMSHLLDEINRYTDEARALRLKLDAILLRKSQIEPDRKPH